MRIVLLGFMGSGKTIVAKLLADKLDLKSIEMDDLVLMRSHRKNINEIFAIDGEEKFRALEFQVAKELLAEDGVVISTGGGVVMNKSTMNCLLKNSFVIYLKSSFKESSRRVKLKEIKPPLFQNLASAKKLFKLRQPIYRSYANVVIMTDKKKESVVVKDIIVKLKGAKYGR